MSGIQMSNIKTKEPTTEDDFLEEVKTSNPEEYEYFEKQQADLDEIDGLISEEFDATGDESMMRVMKMFEDYNIIRYQKELIFPSLFH